MKYNYVIILVLLVVKINAVSCATYYDTTAFKPLKTNLFLRDYSSLPIKTERTISFDTDEGSRMHVDISPDGNILLFTILGDIYIVPSNGGESIQLTRGIGVNSAPVWSPDGNYIAFTSDATGRPQTHVRSIRGDFHVILNDRPPPPKGGNGYNWPDAWQPLWLANSKFIVSNDELFDLSGSAVSFSDNGFKKNYFKNNLSVQLSGDGNYIYALNYPKINESDLYKIQILTGDTLQAKKIKFLCYPDNVKISPDAKWVSYTQPIIFDSLGMAIIDTETGVNTIRVRMVGFDNRYNGTYGGHKDHYGYSKDSKNIFIGYGGKIHKLDLYSQTDQIVPFRAKVKFDMGKYVSKDFPINYKPRKLLNIRNGQRDFGGNKIVASGLRKIFLFDKNGTKKRTINENDASLYQPLFSPDGRELLYLSYSDGTNEGKIYLTSADREAKMKIVGNATGKFTSPSWSPDGKKICVQHEYVSNDGRRLRRLETISVNSGDTEILVDSLNAVNSTILATSFSNDGKYIYYQDGGQAESSNCSLYSYNTTSGETTMIFRAKVDLFNTVSISPDRKYVVFSYNNDLFITSVEKQKDETYVKKNSILRFSKGGYDIHWERNGAVISWSFGNTYSWIPVESIMSGAASSKKVPNTFGEDRFEFADVSIQPFYKHINIDYEPFHCKELVAFTNAFIITMEEEKRTFIKGTILVKNGRIMKVEDSDKIKIPSEAKLIDMSGKFIMPGLIDLHEHVGNNYEFIDKENVEAKTYFAYGVTTAFDPSSSLAMLSYQELVNAGLACSPRFYSVGKSVGPGYGVPLSSVADAEAEVYKRASLGAIAIKQYKQKYRIQQQWLLQACDKFGVDMTNEIARNLGEFVGFIKNGSSKTEHMLDYVYGGYKDLYTVLGASKTYITSTNLINTMGTSYFRATFPDTSAKLKTINPEAYARGFGDTVGYYSKWKKRTWNVEQEKFTNEARRNGAIIPLGSHGDDDVKGIEIHYQLWNTVMGGLTNWDALRCVTIQGAASLGLDKDLGSIKKGKIADFLILNKNPLVDIHHSQNIDLIVKDGIIYNANTLEIIR